MKVFLLRFQNFYYCRKDTAHREMSNIAHREFRAEEPSHLVSNKYSTNVSRRQPAAPCARSRTHHQAHGAGVHLGSAATTRVPLLGTGANDGDPLRVVPPTDNQTLRRIRHVHQLVMVQSRLPPHRLVFGERVSVAGGRRAERAAAAHRRLARNSFRRRYRRGCRERQVSRRDRRA